MVVGWAPEPDGRCRKFDSDLSVIHPAHTLVGFSLGHSPPNTKGTAEFCESQVRAECEFGESSACLKAVMQCEILTCRQLMNEMQGAVRYFLFNYNKCIPQRVFL